MPANGKAAKPYRAQQQQPNLRVSNQGTENVYSEDAEKTLIGTILANGDLFHMTVDHISFRDFFTERHQYIWRAMEKLTANQAPITDKTVRAELQKAGAEYWNAVGQAYLSELFGTVDHVSSVEYYARFIQRLALRRQIISHSVDMQRKARDPNIPEEQVLAESEEGIIRIGQRLQGESMISMPEGIEQVIQTVGEAMQGKGAKVHKTGLIDLDAKVMMVPKEAYLFAARPKVGKSALMLTIAMNMARQGTPLLYLSSEGSMSTGKLMLRAAAMETGVSYEKLFKGTLTAAEYERFAHSMRRIKNLPIIWDCVPRRRASSKRAMG
jgi:replicative DNA helicase